MELPYAKAERTSLFSWSDFENKAPYNFWAAKGESSSQNKYIHIFKNTKAVNTHMCNRTYIFFPKISGLVPNNILVHGT